MKKAARRFRLLYGRRVFTRASSAVRVIFEFVKRNIVGYCAADVAQRYPEQRIKILVPKCRYCATTTRGFRALK